MIGLWAVLAAASPADPAAASVPVDALPPLARRFWDEGRTLEQAGRWHDAAVRYRAVLTADPAFTAATLALARVLSADGDAAGAEATFRSLPYSADAAEGLGQLLYELDRPREAADAWHRLVELRPDWPGARVLEARALARCDAVRAAEVLGEYLSFDGADPVEDGLVAVAAEVAEALRASARRDEAAALVERVLRVDPDSAAVLAELLVRIEVDLEAQALAQAGDRPLLPGQHRVVREARESFARGDVDGARRSLEVLVVDAPLSAIAWGVLGEVRESQGDVVGAEQAWRVAMRLDPRSGEWPARLGDLLSRSYAGRFDAEAAAAYARALRRRPDDAELWFRRAEAERRAGRWQAGVAAMDRVLALAPDGPRAAEARRVVLGASLPRSAEPAVTESPGRPPMLTEDAWWAFLRASAWREREEPWAIDEALTALSYVRRAAPGFAPAAELEAEIRTDRGELDAAIEGWEAILAQDPDRAEANARLAALVARRGESARADDLWARAAASGDPGALYRRASRESAAGRWWAARATLRDYFGRASSGPDFDAALALDRQLASRVQLARAGAVAGGLGVAAVPLVWWFRRRSGHGLDTLVARAPERWRDLAGVLSAVQHEVVKHHFGLLDAVAEGLDDRDPEGARFAADRWFGPEGALARLDGYVAQIEAIGRAAGVRVNLRYRDPRFAPLLAAADELRALEGSLRTGQGRALAERLRTLSPALGRDAHRALGALIDTLCVLPIDADLLTDLHRRAVSEFRARPVPAPRVRVEGGVACVRMFRTDLEDVLVNLIRNALEATPEGGDLTLGLFLRVEEDPVTFLEQVVIRVADHAPGRLTTERLRSRHVSRGLGLAVDLTSRAGGSLRVEAEPGYEKAVVVRVPRVERGVGET